MPVPPTDNVLSFLLWLISFLVLGFAGSLVWIAKYVIIPMRDRHFKNLDNQEENSVMQTTAMHAMVAQNSERMQMHKDNLKLLEANQLTLSHIARILSHLACVKDHTPALEHHP